MTTGTAGTVFLGPEGLSLFGRKVRNIGDLNDDGIADFAISAPRAGNGYDGPGDSVDQTGIVYVLYGRDGDFSEVYDFDFDGTVLPDGNLFSVIQGDLASGTIGVSVNPAGDIDNDGIDDLVVGSDQYGPGGAAFVYFGSADGLPAIVVTGGVGGTRWVGLTGGAGDQFAIEAEGIGDFDGDGFGDLYVSSQNDKTVEIHFGADTLFGGRLDITGADARGAAIGDINGDGLGDIAVQRQRGGDPVVLFGSESWAPGALDLDSLRLDGSNGFTLAAGGGWAVEGLGDVNGDGLGDFLYLPHGGPASLIFGSDSGFPAAISPDDLDGGNGMRIAGAGVSFQIGGTGDINGDGIRDFVLGDQNTGSGTSFIVFGRTDGHPAELDVTTLDGTDGYRLQGVMDRDNLAGGQLGDFNNDGFADLIAGAQRFDGPDRGTGFPAWDVGAAFLVYGGPERLRAFDAADGDSDGLLHLANLGDVLSFVEPEPVPIGGEAGIERIGSEGDDLLEGGGGPDLLRGLGGADRLIGMGGNDTLEGGDGPDTLNGGDGDDLIRGGDTDADRRDVVYAGAGDDSVDGGYGNDQIYGMDGNDTLAGGFGADTIEGQAGDDVITGSAYSDVIWGGAGDDFINGGFGHDLLVGDVGADRFFHVGGDADAMLGHGSDWIQDFGAADVLVFGDAAARVGQFQVNFAHTENSAGERSGADAVEEAFVIYKPTGQILWALVDGAGQDSINLQIGAEVFDLLA